MQNGFGVAQVDVDAVVVRNDFGDSARSGRKNLVGLHEALLEAQVAVYLAQFVVVNYNEGIHMLAQALDAQFCLAQAHAALKAKGCSDDSDGQNAHFAGCHGDYGCSTCSGSAAHACRDEDHLGLRPQNGLNFFVALERGLLANLRIRSGTEAFGQGRAELNFVFYGAKIKSLGVGVADNKVYAAYSLVLHVVDRVGAAAPYANHFDGRGAVLGQVEV